MITPPLFTQRTREPEAMSANSKIEWTDHTFNPWRGCTKVSHGCANCYAETLDKRHLIEKVDHWGKGAPRLVASEASWRDPVKWNRAAGLGKYDYLHTGVRTRRPRVFCASLADWLDDDGVPIEWLARLLALIHATPNLDWLLLTKRPENWRKRMEAVAAICGDAVYGPDPWSPAAMWLDGDAPANVWIGTTTEDQTRADERIPELLKIPATVRFLSCEPLLGPVEIDWALPHGEARATISKIESELLRNIATEMLDRDDARAQIHWVICGGESGPKARPMHPDWARSLRDQCAAASVPFFFKQWGKKAAGRLLDGVEHSAFPA
jgi:protein gp37